MGTVPTFPSFTPGEIPPASKLNSMKTWADYMANVPKAYAYGANIQSLANSPAYPAVVLDGEVYDIVQSGDTDSHDLVTNNTRLYLRTAGKYRIIAQVQFASNTTGVRNAQVRLNSGGSATGGSLIITNQQSPLTGAGTTVAMVSPPYPFAAGDYLELFATQNSGGSLNTVPGAGVTFLSTEWAGI